MSYKCTTGDRLVLHAEALAKEGGKLIGRGTVNITPETINTVSSGVCGCILISVLQVSVSTYNWRCRCNLNSPVLGPALYSSFDTWHALHFYALNINTGSLFCGTRRRSCFRSSDTAGYLSVGHYGSVCRACTQRPGLPSQSFSLTQRSQNTECFYNGSNTLAP